MISYDQRIKPLRDASRVQVRPHTVAYRVTGSSRDGKINRQEAIGVASLLTAALEQPEYQKNEAGQPTSFGVVSLVGDEQALGRRTSPGNRQPAPQTSFTGSLRASQTTMRKCGTVSGR